MPQKEDTNRKWTGVWVPKEWYLCREFSWTEKLLLLEIYYLSRGNQGCWISNKSLSGHLGVTEGHISNLIGKLKNQGDIIQISEEDDIRRLKISDRVQAYLETAQAQACRCSGPEKDVNFDVQAQKKMCHIKNNKNKINISNSKELDDIPSHDPDRPRPGKNKQAYDKDSEAYILSEYLMIMMIRNFTRYEKKWPEGSTSRERTLQKWSRDIDLMLRRDGHDIDTLLNLIQWCQTDSFWKSNILSAGKLRKQAYDLLAKMDNRKEHKPTESSLYDPDPELTNSIITMYKKLIDAPKDYELTVSRKNKFIKTTEQMLKFFKQGLNPETGNYRIPRNTWIGYLRECLIEQFKNKNITIHPGTLRSTSIWDTLMPQHLQELGLWRIRE